MTWDNNDPFDEMIEKMIKQFRLQGIPLSNDSRIRRWSYGYTIMPGPDGRPVFREFGENPGILEKVQENEILTQLDVDHKNKRARILAEIPGVSKEDITINVTENLVTIRVNKGSQLLNKEIPFDVKINPDTAGANYNNGVLDLTLNLEKTDKGKEIRIN
jgi:HSP20 family protein